MAKPPAGPVFDSRVSSSIDGKPRLRCRQVAERAYSCAAIRGSEVGQAVGVRRITPAEDDGDARSHDRSELQPVVVRLEPFDALRRTVTDHEQGLAIECG